MAKDYMKSEGYYMDKLNIEDIEDVAGGLTEVDGKLVTDDGEVITIQVRTDDDLFEDDDPWSNAKKYKGSYAVIKKQKAK